MISLLAALSYTIARTASIPMPEHILAVTTSEVDGRGYAEGWDGKTFTFYELNFDRQDWRKLRSFPLDRDGAPQLMPPRYAAINRRGTRPEPYASSWVIDLATGKELANRSSDLNMDVTYYIYNPIEFPTKLLPPLQYRLPDGGVVQLLTDTAKTRSGVRKGKPISYRPGTWEPIAGAESREPVATVEWVERMSYEGPATTYHWKSWDGNPLPFGSEHVEARDGKYYVRTSFPEPGQKLFAQAIECTDETGKKVLWRAQYASFLSEHSFLGSALVAAWGHDPTRPEALELLDPSTGRSLAKAPLGGDSRVALVHDDKVFVIGANPDRVERWTIRS